MRALLTAGWLVIFFPFISFAANHTHYPLTKLTLAAKNIPTVSPMENISTIFQDDIGYMWFATEDGLLRFDGKNVVYVLDNKQAESLSNFGDIIDIDDDAKHLWVASSTGLFRINKESLHYKQFLHRESSKNVYVNNRVYDVLVDSQARIWVAKNSGVYLFDEDTQTFEEFKPWFNQFSYNNLSIWAYTLLEDDNKNIWIGTSAGGLIRFNPISKSFVHLSTHPDNPNRFASDFVNSLHKKDSNTLLVATDIGLYEIDITSLQFEKINLTSHDEQVLAIDRDRANGWWLVSESKLTRYSDDFSSFERYSPTINQYLENEQALPSAILVDREDNIWAAFKDGGIHQLPASKNRLRNLLIDKDSYLENYRTITGILSTDSALFVATKKYLYRLEKSTNSEVFSNAERMPLSTDLGAFYDITQSDTGDIYVGRDNGFTIIRSEEIRDVKVDARLPTTKALADGENNIWLLAGEQGVKIHGFDAASHEFFSQEKLLLGDYRKSVVAMEVSSNKQRVYLLYKYNGLFYFDLNSRKLISVNGSDRLSHNKNMTITHDDQLLIYNGSNKLGVYSVRSNQFNVTTTAVDNLSCSIEINQDTFYAQSKGSLKSSNHAERIKTFTAQEGMTQKGLTAKHCINDGNGNLLFSSYEGVIIYNPNWEIVEQQSPTLVVSDISLTSIDNKDLVKEKVRIPWRAKNEVAMDYEEGTLAIQLSLLTFSASEYANIRYRIVELDHTWSTVSGSSALISYNFLPYGKFTLQAIGRDFDGIESDLLEIPIHINPPLWATWWAYCFYLFIAALVIFGTFHLRTRAIKAQANKLQAMVNVRTKELAKEKALVEKLLAKKDDEFANISHEFRTPITLILGPIQKLLKSNIRPSTRKTLEMVKRNGFRVLRMVDQILNLEKFKLNQIANYGVIDVKPISTLIAKNFSELANEKGIELTVIQIDDIQLSFTYDAFEKILLNLLSNAVKYTLPGGKVSLAIFQTEGSEIKIQVTDSGIGIPFEQQSAIFERFSRIEDISSTSVVGAGIGLALVKQLVEHHNGRIDLQSEPGKGTQVTVTFLPELVTEQTIINDKVNTELLNMEIESLREVSVEQATNVSTELSDSNGDRPLVLIVEDNLDMRNFIVDSVDDHYEILTAENGQEGLTKAIQHIPDLIISDIMMPKMDGYEFSEQLKDDPVTSHIPLILLTARGDKESRLKGWRQRADEYLTKPFDNEELNLRIESLLSIRKILRERFANEMTNNEDPVWSITSGMSERDQALIIEVDSFFNEHFQDPDLELSRLADRLAMSERQLQRKFKALFDRSPSDYLRSFRLTKSKEQLRKGLRVSEVAFNVGFNSQAYFSKCFKAQFGMTAKEYQESGKVIESATEAQ